MIPEATHLFPRGEGGISPNSLGVAESPTSDAGAENTDAGGLDDARDKGELTTAAEIFTPPTFFF
jgi:hypothetical protein